MMITAGNIWKGIEQKMKRLLIVIDMQNDFIDAALGTPEAVEIVDAVKEKIRTYPAAHRRLSEYTGREISAGASLY